MQEKNTWRTRDENREGGIKTDGTRKRPREKKRGEVELSLADQRLQEENNASRWCRFYDFSAGEKRERKKRATLALPHCEGREEEEGEEDPEMEATISMRIPFH